MNSLYEKYFIKVDVDNNVYPFIFCHNMKIRISILGYIVDKLF